MITNPFDKESPLENHALRCEKHGDGESPIRIFFFEDALDELVFAAGVDDHSRFSVLTGAYGIDDGEGFVETYGFEGAYFHPDSLYDDLRKECDDLMHQSPPQPLIVGLFCSVPDSEGALSALSMKMHLSLFNVPFQPLFMFDPNAQLLSAYVRAPGTGFSNVPFWTVHPNLEASDG